MGISLLFFPVGDFYVSGTQDAEVTKSLRLESFLSTQCEKP